MRSLTNPRLDLNNPILLLFVIIVLLFVYWLGLDFLRETLMGRGISVVRDVFSVFLFFCSCFFCVEALIGLYLLQKMGLYTEDVERMACGVMVFLDVILWGVFGLNAITDVSGEKTKVVVIEKIKPYSFPSKGGNPSACGYRYEMSDFDDGVRCMYVKAEDIRNIKGDTVVLRYHTGIWGMDHVEDIIQDSLHSKRVKRSKVE